MIYLSSNKQRQKKIKDICKKYKEPPPYIVKQIIDYELSKEKKIDLHRTISEVRVLNERITIYKNGIEAAIKSKKLINNCDIYECPVFIDLGNGYCSRMTIEEAMDKLELYRKIRRECIMDAKYEHMIKRYVAPFQEGEIPNETK